MRFDPRYTLPAGALAIVILVVIFVQLCGSESTPKVDESVLNTGATATLGPTFTPGPSPTPGPPSETPGATEAAPATVPPDAPGTKEERDVLRQQDLAALQAALQQYQDEHDEYPDSKGGIQTFCVYREIDAGCKLDEFLSQLPQDPLGNPAKNGYHYTSDGSEYTVYAQREADQAPQCAEHPAPLKSFKSLMCVTGP